MTHLALVGPTAAGKSALAHAVALRAGDVEVLSADSMQVYRGMDIGTAKPTPGDRAEVPYHLIDLAEPEEEFSVARFQREAAEALARVEAAGRRAILVGGSGLYVRAVVDGLNLPGRWPEVARQLDEEADRLGSEALHARLRAIDPLAAERMLPANRRRVVRALEVCLGSGRPFSSFGPGLGSYPPTRFRLVGVTRPRPELDARIEDRYRRQMGDGFLEEVRALAGRELSRTAAQALGYRELLAHLAGRSGLDQALDEAVRRTRSFARRQESWFRRDPRIRWLEAGGEYLPTSEALLRDWAA